MCYYDDVTEMGYAKRFPSVALRAWCVHCFKKFPTGPAMATVVWEGCGDLRVPNVLKNANRELLRIAFPGENNFEREKKRVVPSRPFL